MTTSMKQPGSFLPYIHIMWHKLYPQN